MTRAYIRDFEVTFDFKSPDVRRNFHSPQSGSPRPIGKQILISQLISL